MKRVALTGGLVELDCPTCKRKVRVFRGDPCPLCEVRRTLKPREIGGTDKEPSLVNATCRRTKGMVGGMI